MSVRAAGNVLAATTKQLWRKWDEARHEWRDEKAEEFEQKYLVELQASVDRAGIVFNQIEKILSQVRDDCE
jgi:thymidylate synthase